MTWEIGWQLQRLLGIYSRRRRLCLNNNTWQIDGTPFQTQYRYKFSTRYFIIQTSKHARSQDSTGLRRAPARSSHTLRKAGKSGSCENVSKNTSICWIQCMTAMILCDNWNTADACCASDNWIQIKIEAQKKPVFVNTTNIRAMTLYSFACFIIQAFFLKIECLSLFTLSSTGTCLHSLFSFTLLSSFWFFFYSGKLTFW